MAEQGSRTEYFPKDGANIALVKNVLRRDDLTIFSLLEVSIVLANGYGSKDENGAWNGMIKEVLEEVGVTCSWQRPSTQT